MLANLENSPVATGPEKVSVHSIPKVSAKECLNYCTIAFILHTCKVMLKILQVGLQQYVNRGLQMCKLDLEQTEEPEIKLPASTG